MKVLCIEYSQSGETSTIVGGDDMLLRTNQDFYVPHFAEELSCSPQVVIRIDKLGKCISTRFASRYYTQMCAGIIFHADSLENKLKMLELPTVPSFTFEGAAAIGELQPFTPTATLTMIKNGETVFTQNLNEMHPSIDSCIGDASQFHLMKMGDLVYCGSPVRIAIKKGDKLELYLNDKLLTCSIL